MNRLRIIGLALGLMLVGLSVEAFYERPVEMGPAPDLENLVPMAFGAWTTSSLTNVVAPLEQADEDGTATLYRTYENERGDFVTLVVAYGSAMGDSVRLHNPAVCYRAQGFEVAEQADVILKLAALSLPLRRLSGKKQTQTEQVAFWLRVGNRFANGQAAQQIGNLLSGDMKGADSTLVRISVVSRDADYARLVQDDFITAFIAALPDEAMALLLPQEAI